MTTFTDIVTRFGVRVLTFAALGVVVVVGYGCLERQHQKEKELLTAAANEKLAATVAEIGATQGELVKERDASKLLGSRLAKAYQALKAKGATLESRSDTKIEISDSTSGAVLPADLEHPGGAARWQDEHHRFTLQLPSGPLQRRQLFGVEGIVVRSADGTIKATDYNFKEFDPETKAEIPVEGAKISTAFQFIEEKAQGPGRWHLRAVAGIDYKGSPGAGVQINPLGNLTVGVLGLYNPRDKAAQGVLHVGYRLFSSTVSAGPYIGLSSKGGGWLFGAAATIELSR